MFKDTQCIAVFLNAGALVTRLQDPLKAASIEAGIDKSSRQCYRMTMLCYILTGYIEGSTNRGRVHEAILPNATSKIKEKCQK